MVAPTLATEPHEAETWARANVDWHVATNDVAGRCDANAECPDHLSDLMALLDDGWRRAS